MLRHCLELDTGFIYAHADLSFLVIIIICSWGVMCIVIMAVHNTGPGTP